MNEPTTFETFVTEPAQRVYGRMVEYLPHVVGAVMLILIGLLVAWVLSAVTVRLLRFAMTRLQRWRMFAASGAASRYEGAPVLVGRLVFWFIVLFSIAVSIEALGLRAVSGIFRDLTTYLPQVLAAALIVLIGVFLGDVAYSWITRMAARMGVAAPEVAARLVQFFIWGVAAMIAINQLGIDSTALLILLAVIVGSASGASALAFGLGARVAVGNIIASHYAQKDFAVGDRIRIDGLEGEVASFSRTHVVLKNDDGITLIPAQRFSEHVAHVISKGG